MLNEQPIISLKNLTKLFDVRRGILSAFSKKEYLHAVDGIDLEIESGKVFALVGESGCGKTTVGRLIIHLEESTEGIISFKGRDVSLLKGKELKDYKRKVQIIFQNPYEVLDPRQTIKDIILEPLEIHGIGTKGEKIDLLNSILFKVGLQPPETYLNRFQHELSGGERQRVAIARAMILNPEFLIADEPVSMLDVSLRSSIINLMKNLQEEKNLSMLFITHDLSIVRNISDSLVIMYLGKIVEIGPTEKVLSDPKHPYSKLLISAVPIPDPTFKRNRIEVNSFIPSPINLPEGCRFHPRCPFTNNRDFCKKEEPKLIEIEKGHKVSCYLYR